MCRKNVINVQIGLVKYYLTISLLRVPSLNLRNVSFLNRQSCLNKVYLYLK